MKGIFNFQKSQKHTSLFHTAGRHSIHISRQQTDAEKRESAICKIVAAIIPASKRYSVPNRVIKL